MKRCFSVLSIVVLLACALPAFSQDDVTRLAPEAFTTLTRPGAIFDHDAHNEKAALEDCGACHHGGADGVINPDESSEGTPCADCHAVDAPKGQTKLVRAYHQQCIGCHQKSGKGPLACGQCHKK